MKQYKKRTVALVLASVVTVVGAFGAENYKNSLMSLKFDEGSDKSVKMTLLTKQRYDNNINIIKKDAVTYVVTLPETDSQVNSDYELGDNVESVDIKTLPYTKSKTGGTRITVKLTENIPLFTKTSLYLPADSQGQLETALVTEPAPPVKTPEPKPEPVRREPVNTIHSGSGVDQTSAVDINKSVKQFQPSKPAAPAVEKPVEINQEEEKTDRTKEVMNWLLGIALVIVASVYLFLKAKDKIADITGEQTKLDLSDEPKTEKKKKPEKINTAIKNLDRKYSNPVKMPVTPPPQAASAVKDEPEMEPEVETTVVDLDELLQEQNKVVEQAAEPENEEEENTALEEFLSAYNFDDEASEEEDEKESFNEELYDKCINDKNLEFSKDDVERIETLINSEISDDAMRNASEFLESSEKDKKPSPLELLEKFVTVYAVQQNVSFTKDDVDALNKLINVEIDNSFITDLRTDPDRMREMQDEIAKQKSKPHKTSELLTLNVKDMLPDLSEALKKQGGRRIESEVKPQVVYFSEGYDVSTLKLNDALPDLSKEIDNDEAYKARPSDEIELVDTSYEVQKMSIAGELPDLTDVLKNPEKYETPEPEPEEVDEEALLKNITNVTFKPFDDGTREFEVLNDFDDSNAPSVSDMQEEFNQLGDNFEIINQEEEIPLAEENDNDDFEALYDNNNYVDLYKDLDAISEDDAVLEEPSDAAKLLEMIKDIEEKKKSKEAVPKPEVKPAEKPEIKKEKPINAPEFCILDGERFSILNVSYFTDKMGCYLAKNEQGYCIIGFVGDRVFKIKHYEKLNVEKLQSRVSEKLDDGTLRYIVRIGIHKFIMNVKKDDMEFVMDLC